MHCGNVFFSFVPTEPFFSFTCFCNFLGNVCMAEKSYEYPLSELKFFLSNDTIYQTFYLLNLLKDNSTSTSHSFILLFCNFFAILHECFLFEFH